MAIPGPVTRALLQAGVNDLWGPGQTFGSGPAPAWQDVLSPAGGGTIEAPGAPAAASPQDDTEAMVQRLLAGLDQMRAPEYTPPNFRQRFFGTLSDALLAASQARLGAPPQPGPYGRRLAAEQAQQRTAEDEAAKYNADARNRAKLMFAEEALRAKREKELAAMRAASGERIAEIKGKSGTTYFAKSYTGVDERPGSPTIGQRMQITDWFDKAHPEQGIISRSYGTEQPFADVVVQGTTVDASGKPHAGFFNVPRRSTGGGVAQVMGPRGTPIEPLAPPGLAAEAGGKGGVVSRFPQIMDAFNEANDALGGSDETLGQFKNWVKNKIAGTSVGPIVTPAPLVNYYRKVRSSLFPIIKAGSGANFPEKELARWESRFPLPGVDTPETAPAAWDALIDEIITDITAKYGAAGRTPPVVPRPVIPGGGKSALGQTPSTSGKSTQDVLEEIRRRRLGEEPKKK